MWSLPLNGKVGNPDERYPEQLALWVPKRRDAVRDNAGEFWMLPESVEWK